MTPETYSKQFYFYSTAIVVMSIIIYASLPHWQVDGIDKECPPPTQAIGDAWRSATLLLKTLVCISVYKRGCRIVRNVSSLVTDHIFPLLFFSLHEHLILL